MNLKKRKYPLSIIIAEILFLVLIIVSSVVLRMMTFSKEAIQVYDYAHPTCMQMYRSLINPSIDDYSSPWIIRECTGFIHDSVWQKIAHPSVKNKKVASISQIDFLKIIQLDLDGDTIVVKVKNNFKTIESSFSVSINSPKIPNILDSVRRIGLLPNVHQLIFYVTVTDNTTYQNLIILLDELIYSRIRIPFYMEHFVFNDDMKYFEKAYSKLKIVRSNASVKKSLRDEDSFLRFWGINPSFCGTSGMDSDMKINQGNVKQKPSIVEIFIDYLNPFGKNLLYKERWWHAE
ncbi:MAG: hypothetical protein JST20_13090 [Bacteroidetes bacterium]|nr:hypothetical protein [Bacteroidota bacterium]